MLDHLFIGQAANYRWILGHWVRELQSRVPGKTKIWWLPISFSKNNVQNRLLKYAPLPSAKNYFFSFPTIFENYFEKFPDRLKD